MKLSDAFDQNPPCTFDKIGETHFDEKRSHCLTLRAKVKVIAKIKSQSARKRKAYSQIKYEQGSLSNWCDTEEDADISQTLCRPLPYGGST